MEAWWTRGGYDAHAPQALARQRGLIELAQRSAPDLGRNVRIRDLHVWRIGKGSYACVLSLVTTEATGADYFRKQLQIHEELVHITVEVQVG